MNYKARLYRYTRLHNPPKYLVVVFRKTTPETQVFDEAITNQMIEKMIYGKTFLEKFVRETVNNNKNITNHNFLHNFPSFQDLYQTDLLPTYCVSGRNSKR